MKFIVSNSDFTSRGCTWWDTCQDNPGCQADCPDCTDCHDSFRPCPIDLVPCHDRPNRPSPGPCHDSPLPTR